MVIDSIREAFQAAGTAIADGPVVPEVTAGEIRAYLRDRYAFDEPLPLDAVSADVEAMLARWQVQVTHPRYFGLFNPSVSLASVVAETLVAIYNPQLANWRTSPAANEIERHVLAWLAAKFGMPADTLASFTSGGMEANLQAIVVALTHVFPAYGEQGLRALHGQPTVYLTDESHNGFLKIAHMTGLGRSSFRIIRTDGTFRMDLPTLRRRVAEDRAAGMLPCMVVGNAGTTAAGAIDPLPELAAFCAGQGLWFHVDAAWGGAAILSPTLRGMLDGIAHADSITCDAHKWFSVAMGSGMFFCRHPRSVAAAFRAEVSYMPAPPVEPGAAATFDPFTTSAQWSRRFIGLKLFMALAEQGEAGYAAQIDHQTLMGTLLRDGLAATGWQIVNHTPLPLICFTRPGLDPARLLALLRTHQVAWMSEARLGSTPVIRACVTSFRTTADDVAAVLDALNRLAPQACLLPEVQPEPARAGALAGDSPR